MNISIISTSPRKESNSLKVAKALKKQLESVGYEQVNLINFEDYDIPMLGQGSLNKDQLSDFQKQFLNALSKGDLILLTIPEYNWLTSGQIINAIHQLGNKNFDYVFDNKVFALVGVSSGRGGRLPGLEITTLLNKVINFSNKYSIVSPRILESHETGKNLDAEGNSLGNELYDKTLQAFVDYSLEIAKRWFKS